MRGVDGCWHEWAVTDLQLSAERGAAEAGLVCRWCGAVAYDPGGTGDRPPLT